MPWAYFGSKHGLARKYPPPAPRGPIIEPFAGSAGYSVYWATPGRPVYLYDTDPEVIETWHRLQRPDAIEVLRKAESEFYEKGTTTDLLIRHVAGLTGVRRLNPYTLKNWPGVRNRILQAIPLIRTWTVELRDYREVPNRRGTWFIDPPYRPSERYSTAGNGYAKGADDIDYEKLSDWCRSRRGMTMVCEQYPADWLPFRGLARQNARDTNNYGQDQARYEMIWTKGLSSSAGSHARDLRRQASLRRGKRLKIGRN